MNRNLHMLLAFLALCTGACDDAPVRVTGPAYQGADGVFIVNEGNFLYDNASLAFYDPGTGNVQHNIFFKANEVPLGDVAQSICYVNDALYVVVNNSGKIYGIDPENALVRAVIRDFESPRYMVPASSDKAYVSDMYARKIYIIDLQENRISGSINTDNHTGRYYQHSAEQMVILGRYLYAACWSYDNMILVIDTQTDRLIDSIEVTCQPNSILLDGSDNLWVLSDGGYQGSSYPREKAALTRINTATNTIAGVLRFKDMDQSPFGLASNAGGDTLYYINKDVFAFGADAGSLPVKPVIEAGGRNFYSLGIDPVRGDIYVSDAIDFQQPGYIYRYGRERHLIDSFPAGVIPGGFYFTKR